MILLACSQDIGRSHKVLLLNENREGDGIKRGCKSR